MDGALGVVVSAAAVCIELVSLAASFDGTLGEATAFVDTTEFDLDGSFDCISNMLSMDSIDVRKWMTKFSLPFTLLNMVFFSSGKSILLRELVSFSLEIIIRLLSSGRLTRPIKSFLVYDKKQIIISIGCECNIDKDFSNLYQILILSWKYSNFKLTILFS